MMAKTKRVTVERLMRLYTKADRERICLQVGRHKVCGVYLCAMEKGHENSADRRLRPHQAACRKHHCCIVSWA